MSTYETLLKIRDVIENSKHYFDKLKIDNQYLKNVINQMLNREALDVNYPVDPLTYTRQFLDYHLCDDIQVEWLVQDGNVDYAYLFQQMHQHYWKEFQNLTTFWTRVREIVENYREVDLKKYTFTYVYSTLNVDETFFNQLVLALYHLKLNRVNFTYDSLWSMDDTEYTALLVELVDKYKNASMIVYQNAIKLAEVLVLERKLLDDRINDHIKSFTKETWSELLAFYATNDWDLNNTATFWDKYKQFNFRLHLLEVLPPVPFKDKDAYLRTFLPHISQTLLITKLLPIWNKKIKDHYDNYDITTDDVVDYLESQQLINEVEGYVLNCPDPHRLYWEVREVTKDGTLTYNDKVYRLLKDVLFGDYLNGYIARHCRIDPKLVTNDMIFESIVENDESYDLLNILLLTIHRSINEAIFDEDN